MKFNEGAILELLYIKHKRYGLINSPSNLDNNLKYICNEWPTKTTL